MVYSIDNLESLNILDNYVEVFKEYANEVPLFLVGNKSDLEKEREVSLEQGLTKQFELGYFMHIETSTTNDLEAIDYLFKRVAEEIVERNVFSQARGFSLELPK